MNGITSTFKLLRVDPCNLTIKNTLMNSYQLLAVLCLVLGLCSCSSEDFPQDPTQSDLIGHWNITVRSGLQFVEFIEGGKILIDDRGAIGTPDISKTYYHDYKLKEGAEVIDLPSESRMTDISIKGDRMTFVFINDLTGYRMPYTAYRVEAEYEEENRIELLSQTWITVKENGIQLTPENQKVAHFSKAGIYFIKDLNDDEVQLFSWQYSEGTEREQICYTKYQRPTILDSNQEMISRYRKGLFS